MISLVSTHDVPTPSGSRQIPLTGQQYISMLQHHGPKLRVHPAPGAHIFMAGCTLFGGVHAVCPCFLSHLLLLYIGRCMELFPGAQFSGTEHLYQKEKNSVLKFHTPRAPDRWSCNNAS